MLKGTFTLTVVANAVAGGGSGYGDEVNRFGNGFDSFQAHQFPGAIIAGWTATQGDRATHFIRERHALRCVPVRIRAPGFRLRALRVRPRRRLGI